MDFSLYLHQRFCPFTHFCYAVTLQNSVLGYHITTLHKYNNHSHEYKNKYVSLCIQKLFFFR